MTGLTLRRRALSAALLLCHVIVVGLLVPVVDARLELAAGEGVVHIEAESGQTCPPGHDHLECQFCHQIASRLLAAGSPERVFAFGSAAVNEPVATVSILRTAGMFLPLGSRAPPAA
jgi:hypothetical protein